MKIENFSFDGEGMTRVYENEKWTVGIKNWKPANDPSQIDNLERHLETDELFILLNGRAILLSGEEKAGKLVIEAVEMVPLKVYNIPKGLWHNTVSWKDTKYALIEDSNTGMANSEILSLKPEQLEELRKLLNS